MPYKDIGLGKKKSAERWLSWAQRNPELAKERAYNWRRRNPKYMLFKSAQRRCKSDGTKFTITMNDIPDIPKTCPIALIPIHYRPDKKKGPCDNSPSLDRVDPQAGYIPSNIRVISYKGNRMKSFMTIDDLQRIIDYMKS